MAQWAKGLGERVGRIVLSVYPLEGNVFRNMRIPDKLAFDIDVSRSSICDLLLPKFKCPIIIDKKGRWRWFR